MIQGAASEATAAPPAVTQVYAKLPAKDVERARAFYAEKLGLEPYGERHKHLYYELADAYFIVFPSTGTPSGTHDQLGLVVEDLDAEVAALKRRGVAWRSRPVPRHPAPP